MIKLSDLVQMESPEAVLSEVETVLRSISTGFDVDPVRVASRMIVRVYAGKHPGYRACNTRYHDLRHTTDAFLAMARLIHGAMINGEGLTHRNIITGLIAALFHDAGYIQETHDTEGTGAKYTRGHEERSADFLRRHGAKQGLSREEIDQGRLMILCTDLGRDIETMSFPSQEIALLGRLLNAADLLGQMSDRTYLEKLFFLYDEFTEGRVGDYGSREDMLRRTLQFYELIDRRLAPASEKIDLFMSSHFAANWNIPVNLYAQAIGRQKDYLKAILALPEFSPWSQLRRFSRVNGLRSGQEEMSARPA